MSDHLLNEAEKVYRVQEETIAHLRAELARKDAALREAESCLISFTGNDGACAETLKRIRAALEPRKEGGE